MIGRHLPSQAKVHTCFLAAGLLLGLVKPVVVRADGTPRFETVTSFGRSPEHPSRAGLLNHISGLYGTASEGGNFNCGALFKSAGSANTFLVHFSGVSGSTKGDAPSGALVADNLDGIWGVTTRGGAGDAGTVYKFNTSTSAFATAIQFGNVGGGGSFPLGRNPTIGLAKDGNGKLWGISGGSPAVVFRIDPLNGQAAAITTISPTDGMQLGLTPRGELTYDGVDSMWGVTEDGGPGGYGLIYKIHQDSGMVTVVAMLTGPGGAAPCKNPTGSLALEGSTGNLLGLSAPLNPASNCGTVFRIKISDGAFSVAGTLPASAGLGLVKEGLVNLSNGVYVGMGLPKSPYPGCLFVLETSRISSIQVIPLVTGINPMALVNTGAGQMRMTAWEGGSYDKGLVLGFNGSGYSTAAYLGAGTDPETTRGSQPAGGLVESASGWLWGLTKAGGYGAETLGAGIAYSFLPSEDVIKIPFGFSSVTPPRRHPVGELVRTPKPQHPDYLWAQTQGGPADAEPYLAIRIDDRTVQGPSNNFSTYTKVLTLEGQPNAGLTVASSGKLWSVAGSKLYSFDPATPVLHNEFTFTGINGPTYGSQPSSRLFRDSQDVLWGTTEKGGGLDQGTIYKVVEYHGPTFTSVVKFTGASGNAPGSRPNGPLMESSPGILWGTTAEGGEGGAGTVFKLNANTGVLTTVAAFGIVHGHIDGSTPKTGLTADGRGYLWGSTSLGGGSNRGTLFRINIATEEFETMFEFTGSDPEVPGTGPCSPLVLHSDGNLYGTTPGLSQSFQGKPGSGGNIFRVRFGQRLEVRLNGTSLVDGVPLPSQLAAQLQGVNDIEDSRLLSFLVANRSNGPITGLTALLSGAQAADFTLASPVPDALVPNESFVLDVKFDPGAAGTRNAVLTLGGASPDTDVFVLPLSGTSIKRSVAFEDIGASVIEDGGEVHPIRVTLSAPLSVAVKVPFTVGLGTASKSDFTISASPLVFPPGTTSASIYVTAKKDYVIEEDETFEIVLGTPLHPNVALSADDLFIHCGVVITNDDVLPAFDFADAAPIALGEPFGVYSNLSNPSAMPFTGTWKRNGRVIPGATQPGYYQPKATAALAGTYQYSIRTTTGVTIASNPIEIRVIDFVQRGTYAAPGGTAVLSVVAAGPGLGFRWARVNEGGSETTVSNGGRFSGATTSTLKITHVEETDAATYRCYFAIDGNEINLPIDRPLLVHSEAPVFLPPGLPASLPSAQVYMPYDLQLPLAGVTQMVPSTLSRVTIAGLPPGMTCDAFTGIVGGTPTKAGRFKLTVTLSNGAGKTAATTYIDVLTLPDSLPGSYTGFATGGGSYAAGGSRLDFTVATTGIVTGRLTTGGQRKSFTGWVAASDNTSNAHCLVTVHGSNSAALSFWQIDLTITPEHRVTGNIWSYGTFIDATESVEGWKDVWDASAHPASHLRRYHTFALQGPDTCLGHGSLSVGLDGTTVAGGRLADGSVFTTTAFLHPDNFFMIYQSLYGGKGGLALLGNLIPHTEETGFDVFDEGYSYGWVIPALPATTRYTKNPLFNNASYNLTFTGGSYEKPAAGHNLLDLPVVPAGTDNAQLTFTISSVIVPTTPHVNFQIATNHRATLPAAGSADNPSRVGPVTFNASTGAFSGSFVLDYGTAQARKATYSGMVLPGKGYGKGFFIIPGLANPNVVPAITVKTSAYEPGSVILEPYAP